MSEGAISVGAVIPVSRELWDDAQGWRQDFERWLAASPEQRAVWQREAAEQRAKERADATPVVLTLDTVLAALGWSRAYAEHVVQPYCTCGDSADGWETCLHAADIDLSNASGGR